jgi:hypothetical protein
MPVVVMARPAAGRARAGIGVPGSGSREYSQRIYEPCFIQTVEGVLAE